MERRIKKLLHLHPHGEKIAHLPTEDLKKLADRSQGHAEQNEAGPVVYDEMAVTLIDGDEPIPAKLQVVGFEEGYILRLVGYGLIEPERLSEIPCSVVHGNVLPLPNTIQSDARTPKIDRIPHLLSKRISCSISAEGKIIAIEEKLLEAHAEPAPPPSLPLSKEVSQGQIKISPEPRLGFVKPEPGESSRSWEYGELPKKKGDQKEPGELPPMDFPTG